MLVSGSKRSALRECQYRAGDEAKALGHTCQGPLEGAGGEPFLKAGAAPSPPTDRSLRPSASVARDRCPPFLPSRSGQYSTVILSPARRESLVQPTLLIAFGLPFSNA